MMSSLRSAQQGPELTPVTISPNNHPDLTFNYTEKGDSEEVNHKSKTNLKYSDFTSEIEGLDLGELRQIWKDM